MTSVQTDPNQVVGLGVLAHMLPIWVPEKTLQYLAHTAAGLSLRAIARAYGHAPSTVCRRVRAMEAQRDDPLLDEGLTALSTNHITPHLRNNNSKTVKEPHCMTTPVCSPLSNDILIAAEGRRILRRLCETDAVLVVAMDMDKAVVMRPMANGEQTRTAVVDRPMAQAFAVKDWIACQKNGRVAQYSITPAGKAALKRFLHEDRKKRGHGRDPEPKNETTPFHAQHTV